MQVKIKIEEGLNNYVQALWLEIQMKEEIIQKIITDASLVGRSIKTLPALKEYEKEAIEVKAQHNVIMETIRTTILAPFVGHPVDYTVNFQDCTIDCNINDSVSEQIYKDNKEYFSGIHTCKFN